MRSFVFMATLLVLSTVTTASADQEAPGDAKPSFSARESMTSIARVEAIDQTTRMVTLLLENGELFTTEAGDEVRNLGQVEVGDSVYIHHTESISIQVVAGDGADPETSTSQDSARAGEGRMPGFAATETTVETAIVEAIDLEDGTFKLREVDGEVRQYTARNPDNLRLAEVGDKVVVTATTSVIITVDRTPAE